MHTNELDCSVQTATTLNFPFHCVDIYGKTTYFHISDFCINNQYKKKTCSQMKHHIAEDTWV